MVEVTLSRRLCDRLRSEAASRRLTVEELVNELLSKALVEQLDPGDGGAALEADREAPR